MSIRVLSVFGTRPEAIKMAPLIMELEKDEAFESFVCVTGQHRDMLDSVLEVFDINPDWDLNIMRDKQTLSYVTAAIIEQLSEVLSKCKPDILLVHGDTTTSFAAALAGFYRKIPVGHVEAGLRSFNKYSPFPEEINRTLIGHIADLHFAPTEDNRKNLLGEQITEDIYITGNTVIDAMGYSIADNYVFEEEILNKLDFKQNRVLLLTAHRRENIGEPMENICRAVRAIAESFSDVHVVFPVHKNPVVRELVYKELGNCEKIHLIEPVSVMDMHNLMAKSYLILTDSGGIQEEASALHKPILVLRTETERSEIIENGGALLAGVKQERIIRIATELLWDKSLYDSMQHAANPYGEGAASVKIVKHMKKWMKQRG